MIIIHEEVKNILHVFHVLMNRAREMILREIKYGDVTEIKQHRRDGTYETMDIWSYIEATVKAMSGLSNCLTFELIILDAKR
jgi:hypothetical protein